MSSKQTYVEAIAWNKTSINIYCDDFENASTATL